MCKSRDRDGSMTLCTLTLLAGCVVAAGGYHRGIRSELELETFWVSDSGAGGGWFGPTAWSAGLPCRERVAVFGPVAKPRTLFSVKIKRGTFGSAAGIRLYPGGGGLALQKGAGVNLGNGTTCYPTSTRMSPTSTRMSPTSTRMSTTSTRMSTSSSTKTTTTTAIITNVNDCGYTVSQCTVRCERGPDRRITITRPPHPNGLPCLDQADLPDCSPGDGDCRTISSSSTGSSSSTATSTVSASVETLDFTSTRVSTSAARAKLKSTTTMQLLPTAADSPEATSTVSASAETPVFTSTRASTSAARAELKSTTTMQFLPTAADSPEASDDGAESSGSNDTWMLFAIATVVLLLLVAVAVVMYRIGKRQRSHSTVCASKHMQTTARRWKDRGPVPGDGHVADRAPSFANPTYDTAAVQNLTYDELRLPAVQNLAYDELPVGGDPTRSAVVNQVYGSSSFLNSKYDISLAAVTATTRINGAEALYAETTFDDEGEFKLGFGDVTGRAKAGGIDAEEPLYDVAGGTDTTASDDEDEFPLGFGNVAGSVEVRESLHTEATVNDGEFQRGFHGQYDEIEPDRMAGETGTRPDVLELSSEDDDFDI